MDRLAYDSRVSACSWIKESRTLRSNQPDLTIGDATKLIKKQQSFRKEPFFMTWMKMLICGKEVPGEVIHRHVKK
ncbi:hypothetical protein CUU66_06020 [Peribacillus deserti]|uniref:Uncharacterized protein n=1 Tax=Peribacillus deserti TaxID=673318 RepID=A0A2N5M8M7_9BACI|nr:hypothetical protein CUU66_06020 [Peribacillus deserti]